MSKLLKIYNNFMLLCHLCNWSYFLVTVEIKGGKFHKTQQDSHHR